jgi:hypothetical protein
MLEAPISYHKTVNVTVVNGILIQCGAKGGNLRVKSKTPPPESQPLKIKWKWVGSPSGQQFRLQFFAIALEDDQSSTTPCWPFIEPQPPGCLTQPASEHEYTVRDENIVCKYSVLVDSLHLDPIIIVEK